MSYLLMKIQFYVENWKLEKQKEIMRKWTGRDLRRGLEFLNLRNGKNQIGTFHVNHVSSNISKFFDQVNKKAQICIFKVDCFILWLPSLTSTLT